ncbi:hypothetical protein AXE80_10870 [Wenyingzhuangia fucanilytica]|uniref:Uncharacterized protein n=1 Tax=Wenyingzhuangia fucanilytica TaxID=1790137 RepID=A0A1B1Y7L0_9FLAO|nr:hypothetical protein [Wenyingzhuangia fucanilytica]ANW96746.1 hypothetical protein AXE80_10870 [Wenyingzhuangia fucanilytica]
MNTIEFPKINLQVDLPEYIDEFTYHQYLKYCELMVMFQNKEISFFELKVLLLYHCLNMVVDDKTKLSEAECQEKNYNIYVATTLLDNLFNIETDGNKIRVTHSLLFVDNKIKSITHNNKIYIGPDDLFSNITFIEHIEATYAFSQYAQTKDEYWLNTLVAILYRPQKPDTEENRISGFDGDKRLPFYPATVEARTEEFKTIPFHVKYGVFLWFWAVEEFIATATELDVKGHKCDMTVIFNAKANKQKSIGMPGVLFSLAETRVFGNRKETEQEPYLNILLRLYQNHIDIENAKAKNNVKN